MGGKGSGVRRDYDAELRAAEARAGGWPKKPFGGKVEWTEEEQERLVQLGVIDRRSLVEEG